MRGAGQLYHRTRLPYFHISLRYTASFYGRPKTIGISVGIEGVEPEYLVHERTFDQR